MLESRFVWPILLGGLMASAGCGGSGSGVPVSGVVTLDGKPLDGVHILFDQPELSANENIGYIGVTDETGHYSLRPSMGGGSGLPPGDFRVSLTTAVVDPNAPPPQRPAGSNSLFYPEEAPTLPERIPPAYRDGKLKFTVPAEATDAADFALKSQ